MDLNQYSFRSVWRLQARAESVFEVLADLQSYPLWWPEVRRVSRIDDSAAELTVRSLLPYDLEFTSTQSRRDRAAGILEAAMTGDLTGFSRWTITAGGDDHCTAIFEEVVTAHKALLRRLALVARPAFMANHRLMMHHGRGGLQTYLYGYAMALRVTPP